MPIGRRRGEGDRVIGCGLEHHQSSFASSGSPGVGSARSGETAADEVEVLPVIGFEHERCSRWIWGHGPSMAEILRRRLR